ERLAGDESRAIVEDGVAVDVLAGGDVKGRAGLSEDDVVESKCVRQGNTARHEAALADFGRSPRPIPSQIVRISREGASRSADRDVAARPTEIVVTRQCELRSGTDCE